MPSQTKLIQALGFFMIIFACAFAAIVFAYTGQVINVADVVGHGVTLIVSDKI